MYILHFKHTFSSRIYIILGSNSSYFSTDNAQLSFLSPHSPFDFLIIIVSWKSSFGDPSVWIFY